MNKLDLLYKFYNKIITYLQSQQIKKSYYVNTITGHCLIWFIINEIQVKVTSGNA